MVKGEGDVEEEKEFVIEKLRDEAGRSGCIVGERKTEEG